LDNDTELISFTFVHTFKPFSFAGFHGSNTKVVSTMSKSTFVFFGESLHSSFIFDHQVIPVSLLLAKAYTEGPKLT